MAMFQQPHPSTNEIQLAWQLQVRLGKEVSTWGFRNIKLQSHQKRFLRRNCLPLRVIRQKISRVVIKNLEWTSLMERLQTCSCQASLLQTRDQASISRTSMRSNWKILRSLRRETRHVIPHQVHQTLSLNRPFLTKASWMAIMRRVENKILSAFAKLILPSPLRCNRLH